MDSAASPHLRADTALSKACEQTAVVVGRPNHLHLEADRTHRTGRRPADRPPDPLELVAGGAVQVLVGRSLQPGRPVHRHCAHTGTTARSDLCLIRTNTCRETIRNLPTAAGDVLRCFTVQLGGPDAVGAAAGREPGQAAQELPDLRSGGLVG